MKSHVRAPVLVLCLCLGIALSSFSQQPTPPTSDVPTFRSRTSLVLVPVIVTKAGQHVQDLTKPDFTLLDNGSPRIIASFEEVAVTATAGAARSLGPGVFTNAAATELPQRMMVVALDLLNTPFQKQTFSREAMIRFLLGRPDANEPVMVVAFTPDGLRIIHHFSSDPSRLVAALRDIKRTLSNQEVQDAERTSQQVAQDAVALSATRDQGAVDVNEAEQLSALLTALPRYAAFSRDQDRTMQTLYQMQQLARALAGVPGRKSLIWVTGGLSFYEYLPDPMAIQDSRTIAVGTQERGSRAYEAGAEFERTWALLSDASVAVYPIDVAEVTVPSFTEAMYMLPHHMGSALLKSQAMLGMTENTGGSYCQLQATLEDCFRNAMRDSAHYYLVAFYADSRAKPGWHKLQVKVHGKDVHLRSRGGYFQDSVKSTQSALASAIQQSLAMPLDSTGILLAVRWLEPPTKEGGKATYELFVDPNSIGFGGDSQNQLKLSVMVASSEGAPEFVSRSAKVVEGKLTPEKLKKISAEGFLYRETVDVPKNTKAIRFIVREETSGRVGTLTVMP